jgi:large repetitive protein
MYSPSMKKKVQFLVLKVFLLALGLLAGFEASAQCPTSSTISSTDVSCKGGADATVTATYVGAVPPNPASYVLWRFDGAFLPITGAASTVSNGGYTVNFTGLQALPSGAVYFVSANFSGCALGPRFTFPVAVNEPIDDLTLVVKNQTNVTGCFGDVTGSVTVEARGGNGGYQYSFNGQPLSSNTTYSNLAAGTYGVQVVDSKGCIANLVVVIIQPSRVNATNISVNPTCNGNSNGSITVNATGGTPNYSYSLNGGAFQSSNVFTGLVQGTYTIQILDANNCAIQTPLSVTLTQPPVLDIVLTSKADIANCFGDATGAINVATAGGTPPYQYSVNSGSFTAGTPSQTFPNLIAGVYNIVVKDANGCQTPLPPVTLTQPPQLVVSLTSQNDILCNGNNTGAVSLTAGGGTAPYEFSFNGGAFTPGGTTRNYNTLTAGTYNVIVRDSKGCTTPLSVVITQPPVLSISLTSSKNISCNGGTDGQIISSPSGGTSPYEFSLNGGTFTAGTGTFNNLTAGTYSVVVRDVNGCTQALSTVILTEPLALLVNLTSKTDVVNCFGDNSGSITVSASGGTSPYEYSLNSGAFAAGSPSQTFPNLTAGIYNIIVRDSKGCQTPLAPVVVGQPSQLAVSLSSQTNILCNGSTTGNFTVNASGGTPGYEYSLNGGAFTTGSPSQTFNSLAAGTYNLVVRDSKGCTQTLPTVTIIQPTALQLSFVSSQNISCNGGNNGQIVLSPSGGTTPYEFSLNGGAFTAGTGTFNNLTAGTYSVVVRDVNGCTQSSPALTLTQPPALTLTLSSKTNIPGCFGDATGQIVVTAGGGAPAYEYSINGGAFIAGSTSQTFNSLTAGVYTIVVRDSQGCQTTLSPAVSIVEPTQVAGSLVSQVNPACNGANTGSFTVAVTGGVPGYRYSINGTAFLTGGASRSYTGLAAGTYTIRIRDTRSCESTVVITLTQPPALSVSLVSQNNISCSGGNDGQIVTTVSGGTAPYEFSVNGGAFTAGTGTFSSLTAGTYSVVVRDANGCTTTLATVTLAQPPALLISLTSKTDATCNGATDGSITVSASGGTVGYEYSLNGGAFVPGTASQVFNSLAPGTYSVIVRDSKGCQTTLPPVTIAQPVVLTLNLTSKTDVVNCFGDASGQIVAGVSGGTAPFQFSVNGGSFTTGFNPQTFSSLTAGTYSISVKDANGCTAALAPVTIAQPSQLAVALGSQTNILCNGNTDGTFTANVTGGTSPYEFSLNGGAFASGSGIFSNLSAGVYNLTVRDSKGCQAVLPPVTITQLPLLTVSLTSSQNISCSGGNDGQIVTAVSGGTSPYEFSLNGGTFTAGTGTFNSLTAGTYAIVVRDANGCTKTLPAVTLTEPPALLINLTSKTDVANCFGDNSGSITVGVSGGTPPYQYSLNGGAFVAGLSTQVFSSLTAGSYVVIVRDTKNCETTLSPAVIISQPSQVNITLATQTNPVCNGGADGQITVNASGGTSPYEYSLNGGAFQLSPSFSSLAAGTYTIAVRDAKNCSQTLAPVTLANPAAVALTLSSKTDVSCGGGNNGVIQVSASGGTSPYQFSLNGGAFSATNTFNNLTAGNYLIAVQDAKNCSQNLSVTISQPTAITGSTAKTDINICAGILSGSITVTAGGGTTPYTYSLNGGAFQGSNVFSGLTAGSYAVTIRDANNCTLVVNETIVLIPSNLTVTLNLTDVGCFGASDGQIDITTVTGGTGSYEYSLNGGSFQTGNTFTGLPAGTYTLIIRDKNSPACTLTLSPVINQPAATIALVLTSKTDIANCFGDATGQIVTDVSGGTSPYEYSLNGGAFTAGTPTQIFNNLTGGTYTVVVRDSKGCSISLSNIVLNQPPALTLAVGSQTNITGCFGDATGSLTLATSGGTAPYTYSLNGGAFQVGNTFGSLSAGTYSVVVKDSKNCQTTLNNIIITQPALLALTLGSKTDPTCAAGSLGNFSVLVSGGTAPYEFSLNGGAFVSGSGTFNNLTAGTYNVSVRDAKGCTQLLNNILISAPASLVVNLTKTNPAGCGIANGTITVSSVTGGSGNYQFSLDGISFQVSNIFNTLADGTYTVYVKDVNNACQVSQNISLTSPTGITAASAKTDIVCNGASNGTITVSGTTGGSGTGYQFSLNGGTFQTSGNFTGLAAGNYVITVKDNATCQTTLNVSILQPPALQATVSGNNLSSCTANDGSLTVSGISGGSGTYEFSLDGTIYQAGASFTGLSAGNYTVYVRDATNPVCFITRTQTLTAPNAISATLSSQNVKCFGGNDGQITVTNPTGGSGQFEYSKDGTTFQAGAVFSNLTAGTYNITVRDKNSITCKISLSSTITAPVVDLAISLQTKTDPGCGVPPNGSIVVNTTGGTSPYEYSLNGGAFAAGSGTFSSLAAGTYNITVRDGNACTKTLPTVTLATPSSLTATLTPTSETACGAVDGKITVTGISGAAGPYTFFINGSPNPAGINNAVFSNLLPGSYNISVVAANGCNFAQTVSVGTVCVPVCNITATAAIVPVTCNGTPNGSAFLVNVAGGSGQYEYNLNGGTYQATANFTSLAAGAYTIGVRDKNNTACVVTFPVTIVAQFQVSAIIVVNQPKSCNDKGSIEFTNVAGGTAPYQFSIDGGATFQPQTSPLFANLSNGTYQATIKDANNCSLSTPISIIGTPPITATASQVSAATCAGGSNGSVQLSNVAGGSGTYVYSIDGTNFGGSLIFSNLKAGIYTLYVKDQTGTCISTFPVTVTEPNPVVGTTNLDQPSSCSAKDGRIQINVVSGNIAPLTYNLNGGAFQSSSTFNGVGNGTYTAVIRNGSGCTDTLQISLLAPNSIVAEAEVVSSPACNGGSDGSLRLKNVSGGTGTYEYSVNGTTYQDTPLFTGLKGGIYVIFVRDKGIAVPCLSSYTITLSQPPANTATITGTNPTTCTAKDGKIDISNIAGGLAPYTVSLDSLTGYQAALSFINLDNRNYKVYVKDGKGCISVFPQNLLSPGGVTVSAPTLTSPLCKGGVDGSLKMNGVTGGTAPYQFSLDDVNYQNTGTFSNLKAGAYTVYVKDQTGCKYPFAYTLTDPAGIGFTVVMVDSAACGVQNGKLEVQNVSGGKTPYLYSLDGTTFQASPIFANLAAGSYNIFVRDNSASTCPNKQTATVTGTPPVTFRIDSVGIGCQGGNVGKIIVYQIKGGVKPYKVSIDAGKTFVFVNTDSVAFNNLAAGTYSFVLEYGNGCSFTRSINIFTGNTPLSVKIVSATCGSPNGSAEVIIAQPQKYFYSLNDTNFFQTTKFEKLKPGKYTLYVREGQNDPCKKVFPFTITGPDSLLYKVARTECTRLIFTDIKGGVPPYKVSIDNGQNFIGGSIFSNTFTTPDLENNKEYTVLVADNSGCKSAFTKVKIDTVIRADIATAESLADQPTGKIAVTNIRGGLPPYEILFVTTGSTFKYEPVKDKKAPIDTVAEKVAAGNYIVFIRDAAGCVKPFFNVLVPSRDFLIPNVFTPNKDGKNDTFELTTRNDKFDIEANRYVPPDNTAITVFNRWGKVVYSSNNYKNDWDGQENPDGIYYYDIKIRGIGDYRGWVEIWRGNQ